MPTMRCFGFKHLSRGLSPLRFRHCHLQLTAPSLSLKVIEKVVVKYESTSGAKMVEVCSHLFFA